MTTETTETDVTVNPYAQPGATFHWLRSGVIWRAKPAAMFGTASEISARSQTVVITAAMLEASPWLNTYLGDPEAQIEKWGEVRIGVGPFPEGTSRYIRGDADWAEAREFARRAAWAETDPERQAAARAAVEAEFGPAPTTSTHTEIREHSTVRAAREQAERIARGN